MDNVARQSMMTFDGYVTSSNTDAPPKPQRAYTQVSRNGIVEAVASSIATGNPREYLVLHNIEAIIVTGAWRYMAQLHLFGIEPPIVVLASLVNVNGMNLIREFYSNSHYCDLP